MHVKCTGRNITVKNIYYQLVICFSDTGSTPASPPNDDPDTSGEVQKARTAQALRAFLHLLPPGENC